jgi:hypothetical protein
LGECAYAFAFLNESAGVLGFDCGKFEKEDQQVVHEQEEYYYY